MAAGNEPIKKDCLKNTGLKKCFTALVDRKQVNLDMEVLQLMLKKELQINLDTLDQNLVALLPIMLVMYMKTWPGWQRSKEYFSGKLNFKDWYEKFRQYIVLRLNFLIKNGYNNVIEEIKQDKRNEMLRLNPSKSFTEHGTVTDYLAPRDFAPFAISVQCPPSVLNSIVFTDSGDDIVIKQHPDIKWNQINIKQLMHWPYIEMEFFSPELSFKRKTSCEFSRYINFVNTPLKYEKPEYIEQVEIIDPCNGRNCYTLNMLNSYVVEYVNILQSVSDINQREVSIIEAFLIQFLKDVEEIGMNNTMATNTSVLFNIGKCAFLRNKKISKGAYKVGSITDVGYCEIIIPKMETALNFFKAVQDTETTNTTFKYLNILKSNLTTNNCKATLGSALPTIVYKCNYCNLSFKSDVDTLEHLENMHKMDPNVLCLKCKKTYTIGFLSNMRWNHLCSNTTYQNKQGPIIIK